MNPTKTKRSRIVNEKTLIVTVDIGKVTNTGYCRCPDKTEVKPFAFGNHRAGFDRLWDVICRTRQLKGLDQVVVGFESTGSYGEPLVHFLRSKGVRLVQINPLHTKRMKELYGNSPNKTDHKDPKVMADIIELGHALTVIIPESASAELRRLTQARERSLQRRTALFNQLQDLVFVIFPEFLPVMKDIKSRSSQYLLQNGPTPEDMREKGLKGLTQMLKRISRGKLGRGRAEALYKAACESVGIQEGRKSIALEIAESISVLEACERFIAHTEREMSRYLRRIPYSRCILSIKGIGTITAAGLIGETGDFRQFGTLSEILKHAGLDLYEISSGRHKGKRRISKRGRPLLRKLLFFAAMNTVRTGGVMREYYQRYRERMPRPKALVAVARKLLRIIFALVRDHRVFICNYPKLPCPLQEAA